MRLRRWLGIGLLVFAGLILLVAAVVGGLWLYFHPSQTRTNGLVYGQRHGENLTIDVIRPKQPNGLGVVVMASGGWQSQAGTFPAWVTAPLLRHGYTLFAVYHVSQPKATVMEIDEDVHEAVRYIRQHAREHGIDPDRLGVTGGSSGGHLSLMLATTGWEPAAPGDASAGPPGGIRAVAIFYPVTDLLNLGSSTENPGDGGPPRSFVRAFGPDSTNLPSWKVIGRSLSPIYHIGSNLPPVLIYHGDADTLVPLDQSERFQAEARKLGRTVELVVHRGGKHGWPTMLWDLRRFADWFDRHLKDGI